MICFRWKLKYRKYKKLKNKCQYQNVEYVAIPSIHEPFYVVERMEHCERIGGIIFVFEEGIFERLKLWDMQGIHF